MLAPPCAGPAPPRSGWRRRAARRRRRTAHRPTSWRNPRRELSAASARSAAGLGDSRRLPQPRQRGFHVGLGELDVLETARPGVGVGGHVEVAVAPGAEPEHTLPARPPFGPPPPPPPGDPVRG